MNCQKCKKLLNSYIDGTLNKDISMQIEEHLKFCSACKKEYLELKEITSSLDILSSQFQPAPATLTQSIMTKISQEEIKIKTSWIDNLKKQISIPIFSFRFLAPVAATVAIIFFAFTFIFNMPATSPVCSSEVQFSLNLGDNKASTVAIAGDFNNWNPQANLLKDTGEDSIWTGTLKLKPGRYKYMFVIDGKEWIPDPNAIRYVKDGFGNKNAVLEINSCSST